MNEQELKDMSKEEFNVLYEQVQTEHDRRITLIRTELQTDSLNREYMQARDGAVDPANPPVWVQPTGAHDAYPLEYMVTHNEKVWESLIASNVWEPGTSGWREWASETEVAAWVQPTGAHDAYKIGDVVGHNGKHWTSTAEANVWEPGVYGWEEVI